MNSKLHGRTMFMAKQVFFAKWIVELVYIYSECFIHNCIVSWIFTNFKCYKPNITQVPIHWDNQRFGYCCDIILERINFGELCKPNFTIYSILSKVHVSKWYRKRSWTMLKYGLIRGKIRSFDSDNEFVD